MKRPDGIEANDRGFSLIEMLVALALLSLIAAMILGAVQGTGRALEQATRQAQDGSTGAAQLVLRQVLAQGQPIKFTADRSQDAPLLDGRETHVRLITGFAAGGQYGGLYDTKISLVPSMAGTMRDLVIEQALFRRATRGSGDEPIKQRRVVLLKGIAGLSLRYFGRADDGRPGAWASTWSSPSRLPSLVGLSVVFPDGDPRKWSELLVAVRAAD
jgi:general secretion pathway protein J